MHVHRCCLRIVQDGFVACASHPIAGEPKRGPVCNQHTPHQQRWVQTSAIHTAVIQYYISSETTLSMKRRPQLLSGWCTAMVQHRIHSAIDSMRRTVSTGCGLQNDHRSASPPKREIVQLNRAQYPHGVYIERPCSSEKTDQWVASLNSRRQPMSRQQSAHSIWADWPLPSTTKVARRHGASLQTMPRTTLFNLQDTADRINLFNM